MRDLERRKYVRHPIRVRLGVRPKDGNPEFLSRVGDLSEGGVSFASAVPLAEGTAVEVDLPVHDTLFSLHGTVVSRLELPEGFRIGLAFVDPDASFRLKLAEQVLRIVRLQRDLTQQRGTTVTHEQAAEVWVEQYAKAFAELSPRSKPALTSPRR